MFHEVNIMIKPPIVNNWNAMTPSESLAPLDFHNECQVIWTDSVIFKTPKLREANNQP